MPLAPRDPPPCHDSDSADRWLARWREETGSAPAASHLKLLRAIGGDSAHLAALALREPDLMRDLLVSDPGPLFAAVLAALEHDARPEAPRPAISAALRRAKRRGALVVGVADIAGTWDVGPVTSALSDLAEATLDAALSHLLRTAHDRAELSLPRPDRPCEGSGAIVLGMGKLGARELNYSSDVDLVLLFDPGIAPYQGENPTAFFVRIACDLVKLMEERTEGGYVFRTDLRLRPDPAATPLAVSVDAALHYYGSLGQNWERAAMIKARPVAGDRIAGAAFLSELRPFIWRRHLDFAAIRDIHSIKRQIQSKRGGAEIAVAGHNLKLGRGGIREIEFFAQVQQLIWGGRDPLLRAPATLDALVALTRAGLVDPATQAALRDAYLALRRIEHRLQMIDDRQTHSLPEEPGRLEAVARFSGFDDMANFSAWLTGHLRAVERAYAGLFEEAPDLSAPAGSLVFTGPDDDPATIATLATMGFTDAVSVSATVRAWHHGRLRATRSERARELLTELMPALLAAVARQKDPRATFGRLDAFLSGLPAGVHIFSLFQRNPVLLGRVASILGAAPILADTLARRPQVIESILHPGEWTAAPPAEALTRLLTDARHLEEAMDIVRRFTHERLFLIGVAMLDGAIDTVQAGEARAALADATLGALLPRVQRDFEARYGVIPGGGLAVVALGKLGSREMMAGSDLDLLLLYDHGPDAELARGGTGRALSPPEYFGRLVQAFVAALIAPTAEGKLFEIDMRLRPSGNKGPIAVQLDGFRRYQAEEAWTWEHMALTRGRVVAGPPGLAAKATDAIAATLAMNRDPVKLKADATALRARIARELRPASSWDVKYRDGGLLELEFIAQGLVLEHAATTPALRGGCVDAMLSGLAAAGVLEATEAAALRDAAWLFRTVQDILRLTVGAASEAMPEPAAAALVRAVGGAAVDVASLRTMMDVAARTVRQAFITHVGDPERAP